MRIGLIAPPWVPTPPTTYGGTELVVDLLARGLAAAGHEIVLFATGDSTCPVDRAWVHEVAADPMTQTVPEVHHLLAAYERLAEVDLVHDHTVIGPLLAVPGQARPPIVTTCHGVFDEATRHIFRAVARRASIVAISADQARSAGEDVPIDAVIHHGLDISSIPVGAGMGDYVVFLGRMAPTKGAHLAIQAARRAGVAIKLAAKCRERDEIAYFDSMVRPLLGRGAEYLGEIGPRDKLRLLGGAIALVNPIRWREPFGLVMIESLACGTPVVALDWGAAPEIVRHGVTGILCRDPAGLTDAISRVADIRRGACRASAEDSFSAETMVRHYERLYERLLSGAAWRGAVERRPGHGAPLHADVLRPCRAVPN